MIPGALLAELHELDIHFPEPVLARLGEYVRLLEHWNRTVNLTSLRGAELVRRLVAEPLWVGRQIQLSGNLVDIGSGNGSPAIPFCVGLEVRAALLVESRVRKSAFLRHTAQKLGLTMVRVHQGRAEELTAKDLPEAKVDWISLQAVSPTESLLRSLSALATTTTRVVWLTSLTQPPVASAVQLRIPSRNTHAWVFSLDGQPLNSL